MLWRLTLAAVLVVASASWAHDVMRHEASANRTDTGSVASSSGEAGYLAENDAAMTKMMNDMMVKPTGDVDRDFTAMMIPHHQGAIDMARAVLRYGHNEQIRRIAQEIIVDQLQEIAAMRLAVGEPLPPSTAAPTQVSPPNVAEPHPADHHSIHQVGQEH
jgi:uncharacterized protein (DUF305 family)